MSGTIKVIVDKSLNGIQRENFNDYVEGRIGARIPVDIDVSCGFKAMLMRSSGGFYCRCINRKYRADDDRYYQKIQHRISMRLEFFDKIKADCSEPLSTSSHPPIGGLILFERDLQHYCIVIIYV